MAPKAAAKPASKASNKAPANKPATKAPVKQAAQPTANQQASKPAAKVTPAGNGVYVRGLTNESCEVVHALFEDKCGKVQQVRLRRNKFALVQFENSASVKKAIEVFNNKAVSGSVVTVAVAKSGTQPNPRDNTKVVYASPVCRDTTTRKQIFALFSRFGKIVRLRTYANNGVYVYFDTPAAAKKAISDLTLTKYQNQTLVVRPSVRSIEADAAKEASRIQLIRVREYQAAHRQ